MSDYNYFVVGDYIISKDSVIPFNNFSRDENISKFPILAMGSKLADDLTANAFYDNSLVFDDLYNSEKIKTILTKRFTEMFSWKKDLVDKYTNSIQYNIVLN